MSEGVLIGEGVVLDARPASLLTRALAWAIDLGVIFGALMLLSAALEIFEPFVTSQWTANSITILVLVLIMLVIPITVETLTRGRSVGKLALGIRVVRDDGGPVRFRHALVRALTGIVELWMTAGGLAMIVSLCNQRGKRLGDLLAGTYEIRVRGKSANLPPLVMPFYLAGWARQADMRRLPDGLALSARQFLARAPRLHPGSRERLGQRLAGQIEEYVAPGPPPGTHPEAFLTAVLAERRDRDWRWAQHTNAVVATSTATLTRLPYSIPDPPL